MNTVVVALSDQVFNGIIQGGFHGGNDFNQSNTNCPSHSRSERHHPADYCSAHHGRVAALVTHIFQFLSGWRGCACWHNVAGTGLRSLFRTQAGKRRQWAYGRWSVHRNGRPRACRQWHSVDSSRLLRKSTFPGSSSLGYCYLSGRLYCSLGPGLLCRRHCSPTATRPEFPWSSSRFSPSGEIGVRTTTLCRRDFLRRASGRGISRLRLSRS